MKNKITITMTEEEAEKILEILRESAKEYCYKMHLSNIVADDIEDNLKK